jgi:2-polyprenyl-3-methyl-5-hydroxy-6-metoxy-1,4-benzoquinol methylase
VQDPIGVSFSPLTGKWSLGTDASVNYMLVGTKPKA